MAYDELQKLTGDSTPLELRWYENKI
jgi:hypothetical protein